MASFSAFAAIRALVDVIKDAASTFSGFRSKTLCSRALLDLFCTYFILLDVVTEGRNLLAAVGNNPRITIRDVPEGDRPGVLLGWHNALSRQATRLYALSGRLLGQDALAVIDPNLKARLESVVSSKFKRVRTLEGVGAGLVTYSMFADPKDEQWNREAIISMYPSKSGATINVKAAHRQLDELSAALERFRSVCTHLATSDEILAISKRARRGPTVALEAWISAFKTAFPIATQTGRKTTRGSNRQQSKPDEV